MKKRVLYLIIVIILALLAFGFTSCERDWYEDVTPPRVLMISPMDGECNVSLMPSITIDFDKEMDFHSINVVLIDLVTNRPEPCTLYRDNAMDMTLVPKYELYPMSEYVVIVKESCQDVYGNMMTRSYTSRFRTGNYEKW